MPEGGGVVTLFVGRAGRRIYPRRNSLRNGAMLLLCYAGRPAFSTLGISGGGLRHELLDDVAFGQLLGGEGEEGGLPWVEGYGEFGEVAEILAGA